MIPKILHFVWVGDESKRPDNCINTWREKNPSYEIKIWGNESLKDGWFNAHHMKEMSTRELNGVADIMRYEILYNHGGVTLDADCVCVRPLDDWLLETSAFTCWENEHLRPGLLAAGYMGSTKENPFMGQIIKDIYKQETVIDRMAWESVGPQRLTDTWRATKYGLTIYPSHYFIPKHFAGYEYKGAGQVYADQLWGSTRGYDKIS